MMVRKFTTQALPFLVVLLVVGCQTDSREQIFATSESQVALRQIQSRTFDTSDRSMMLRSVIATLQDLSFVIDKADATLGSVSATKLDGYQLRMTVTVRRKSETQLLVRANAQFNITPIEDPEPYQQFFAALRKSVFLAEHTEKPVSSAGITTTEGKAEKTERLMTPTTSTGYGSTVGTVGPGEIQQTLLYCSDGMIPEKPWIGKWVARTDNARFTFEIEEAVVRGELKAGSKNYFILGKVNEQGVIDAKIFGRGGEGGPVDVRGTFPHLRLMYPYAQGPVFKALNEQTLRLCS